MNMLKGGITAEIVPIWLKVYHNMCQPLHAMLLFLVYTCSGYWHGSVTVHERRSMQQSVLNFYIKEAHTLSKIRHENIQLFLGVCLDLHPDSVSLVMG